MPAVLNEHTQYVDSAGKPIVNGTATFGVQGADPEVSPVAIFSDRELTTPLVNPQPLDADGRTINKVWVAGRYSILIRDVAAAQKYINLDNGETADKGITVVENISGGNTIVGTAASTITAYEDLEQYTFRTAQVNTGAVTLNIDTVGATAIVKNHNEPLVSGDFDADQNIIVSYNATDDVFELISRKLGTAADLDAGVATTNLMVVNQAETVTASAATVTLGTTLKHSLTGVVAITAFNGVAGVTYHCTATGTPLITYNAVSLICPTSANIQPEAGDTFDVYMVTAVNAVVLNYQRASGSALVPISSIRLYTANGYGSTNTKIRRFTTTAENVGSDITYADSATLGASFTINTTGVYAIGYSDQFTGASYAGLSLNTTTPTTNIQSVAAAENLGADFTQGANNPGNVSKTLKLTAGDVIRPHNEGAASGTAVNLAQFTIARCG